MGDLSEFRGLLVAGTLLSIFVLLVNAIPGDFLVAQSDNMQVNLPDDVFKSVDVSSYATTYNLTLDDSGLQIFLYGVPTAYRYSFSIGGHHFYLYDYLPAGGGPAVRLTHYWYWWIFPTNLHNLDFIDNIGFNDGDLLTSTELDADYTSGNIRYTVDCDHVNMETFFGFNETAYSSPSLAWAANDLRILFGMELDQVNTSTNAWMVISQVLFFQSPEVHSSINYIIAVPIWLCVAYVTFIVILKVMGAIFAGG